MKRLRLIISTILFLCVVWILAGSVTTYISLSIVRGRGNEGREQIETQYRYMEKYGYYADDTTDTGQADIMLRESYDLIPEYIRNVIDRDWLIVVSEHDPFYDDTDSDLYIVNGTTYPTERVIWIRSGTDKTVVLHEFAHAIDYYLMSVSNTTEFCDLYNENRNRYIESGEIMVNDYTVSRSCEFFAELFVDYYISPEYMEKQNESLYEYMDGLLGHGLMFSRIGGFLVYKTSLDRGLFAVIEMEINKSGIRNSIVKATEWMRVFDKEASRQDPSYEYMSDVSIEIIQTMHAILENPTGYGDGNTYVVSYPYQIPKYYYDEIVSYEMMYFGDEGIDAIDFLVRRDASEITFDIRELVDADAARKASLENVRDVIVKMDPDKDNTRKCIDEVAKYIMDHASYEEEDLSTFASFWENEKGDCAMYAFIFKQFLDELGIENAVVRNTDASVGHMYNRITLENGKYIYYDLSSGIVNAKKIDRSGYKINILV